LPVLSIAKDNDEFGFDAIYYTLKFHLTARNIKITKGQIIKSTIGKSHKSRISFITNRLF